MYHFSTSFFIFIGVLLFADVCHSQAFCNSAFCLNTRQALNTLTDVEFNVKTLKPNLGYAAFGLGTSMSKSEMFVIWLNNNKCIISRRTSVGLLDPVVVPNSVLIQTQSPQILPDGTFSCFFKRAKISPIAVVAIDITAAPISMIWVYLI